MANFLHSPAGTQWEATKTAVRTVTGERAALKEAALHCAASWKYTSWRGRMPFDFRRLRKRKRFNTVLWHTGSVCTDFAFFSSTGGSDCFTRRSDFGNSQGSSQELNQDSQNQVRAEHPLTATLRHAKLSRCVGLASQLFKRGLPVPCKFALEQKFTTRGAFG